MKRETKQERAPRQPRSSRCPSPWHKADSKPFVGSENKATQLADYKRAVDDMGDGAALVDAVRRCRELGEPIPEWVVAGLEQLLSEFVAVMTPGGEPQSGRAHAETAQTFQRWGRRYHRAFADYMVAATFDSYRRGLRLSWDEASEATVAYFRDTRLCPTHRGVLHALTRAKRNTRAGWFRRWCPTEWERRRLEGMDAPPSENSPRRKWWARNSQQWNDPTDWLSGWRARPLTLKAIEVEQKSRHRASVTPKTDRNLDNT